MSLLTRRRLLLGAGAAAALGLAGTAVGWSQAPATRPGITVYKSPT